jgi:hypothetical protein
MHVFVLILLLVLPQAAFAGACKVYGISDSPQKLNCRFGATDVSLRCRSGNYFLNSSQVQDAFHLEVEGDEPVPLVFSAKDMELTVVIRSKVNVEAELRLASRVLQGSCR